MQGNKSALITTTGQNGQPNAVVHEKCTRYTYTRWFHSSPQFVVYWNFTAQKMQNEYKYTHTRIHFVASCWLLRILCLLMLLPLPQPPSLLLRHANFNKLTMHTLHTWKTKLSFRRSHDNDSVNTILFQFHSLHNTHLRNGVWSWSLDSEKTHSDKERETLSDQVEMANINYVDCS